MSSNLKVNSIVPAAGSNVAIGTAGGTISCSAPVSGITTFSDGVNVTSGNVTVGFTTITSSSLTVNGTNYPNAGPLSNRNLVQNGAMTVSQRTTSTSSLTSGNNFILDRWRTYIQDIGTYTISQASDAPTGFRYSYKIQCTTADASPAAADDMSFYCAYEGQDFQHLKKGTASAESVTLSFWVKSNKTTTGQVNFRDQDNNRMISGTYTINSAGTWEYKTITFAGDTSGVLDNDNAASIQLQWYLDSGSNFTSGTINSTWGSDTVAKRNVNNFGLASSTDNYWQITGVQLEVGSVATPFEHRSYGDELARCQRYYQVIRSGTIWAATTNGTTQIVNIGIPLVTSMRALPTTNPMQYVTWHGTANGTSGTGTMTMTGDPTMSALRGVVTGFTGLTDNRVAVITPNTANIQLTAEL